MTALQRAAPRFDDVRFEVEARLLQELGERLVASPDVALLELIKNASDADAPECRVTLGARFDKPILVIADDGLGMSEEDFRLRWMTIAADSKRERLTKRYRRAVTGQKGIGRFAIRYLGAALKLESVSADPHTGERSKIEAIFDWRRLDRRGSLRDASVKMSVSPVRTDHPTGTRLVVSRLKADLREAADKALLTSVLQIVSPIASFDAGPFAIKRSPTTVVRRLAQGGARPAELPVEDPGFKVTFVGFSTLPPSAGGDLASTVIANAWARLTISLAGTWLTYVVRFKNEPESQASRLELTTYPNAISRGLHGDIVFAPKRKNSFVGVGPDGREIWSWIRKNSGVGVVDNGFRIRPYGFEDDDWLYLNRDGAYNRREWRSPISSAHFGITEAEAGRPKLNPALNLASSSQIVGVVHVASRASSRREDDDLIPSMDREGFLDNTAYRQMVDVVRGGLEFLASADKARQLRIEEEVAAQARMALRADLAEVIDEIESDPRLASEEKAALVQHYGTLAKRVTEQEDYDRIARQRLEIAAGLGVVAGFMTHEAERLFMALDSIIAKLSGKLKEADRSDLEEIRRSRDQLDSYIRYTRLYTESLRVTDHKPFSALGQIEWVRDRFGPIADSRGISTEIDCADDVMVPAVPVAMYSAVLLNLYTNATKAVIARDDDDLEPRVRIGAWNDPKQHHLQVQDSGIGIPAATRERIWDPFFTTTSRVNSPLGTGMGLGLSLVRDLLARQGGRVALQAASDGFTTCFHVTLPRSVHAA